MSDGSPQAPSHPEQSATAEIVALENELQQESEKAAVALERVQQQLEDIETAEPDGPRIVSASDASEIGLATERERELLAERDEAVSSLRVALVALERAEAGVPQSEEERLEIEQRARAGASEQARRESDTRLLAIEASFEDAVQRVEAAEASVAAQAVEASRRLSERERELRSESEAAVKRATDKARAEVEARVSIQLEHLRNELEVEARSLAAAWLRGQVASIRRDAERAAEERLPVHPGAEPAKEPLPESPAPGDLIDLNAASFEQLRRLGMSVTQSTRVIAYRDRAGGFGDVDDLDSVPGFTQELLIELKAGLTA
jgi:DNA uptake protein ComE-like DNA-binding protein